MDLQKLNEDYAELLSTKNNIKILGLRFLLSMALTEGQIWLILSFQRC